MVALYLQMEGSLMKTNCPLRCPSQNYLFKNWSGADTSSDNPLLLLVNSNKNLTVNFEEQVSDSGDGVEDSVDQDNSTRSVFPLTIMGYGNQFI